MGFDWKEYLILAQFLGGDSGISYSDEAARRAAVSRAYYAAFCFARNYASSRLGFTPTKTGKDHGNLISWYSDWERLQPTLLGVADNLDELLEWRKTYVFSWPACRLTFGGYSILSVPRSPVSS